MIGEKKEAAEKIPKDKAVIGIDLTEGFAQVCYLTSEQEEPVTMSAVRGEEKLCIPTALAKKYGEHIWTFGEEAFRTERENEGFLFTDLIAKAKAGALIEVETKDYDPVDLLALFIKKCLSLLALVAPMEKVAAIVITVEDPDTRMIQVLNQVVSILRIKPEKVHFQSHPESAYHYVLQQSRDLWSRDVLILEIQGDLLKLLRFKRNLHTSPMVVLMDEKVYDGFGSGDYPEGSAAQELEYKKKDQALLRHLTEQCNENYVSCIYLLGDGFQEQWCKESLKYMCRNRRVFQGSNLFSKGACYGAREKLIVSEVEGKHVFLGKDKLKSNLGMRVMREGEDAYMALLDAGKNWYEVSKECDLILDNEDTIQMQVTPVDGKKVRELQFYLDGCPKRPPRATRIHMEVRMLSETRLYVKVTDLGFGEFFPASGMEWVSEIDL